MFKAFAATTMAMGSVSALKVEKVWTTYDVAPKAADSYAGPTVSPAYDSKKEAAFSHKKQYNNVWRPHRPWLNKYKGRVNHGKWVRAEDRINDGYQGHPSRGYGQGLTKRYSW